MTRRIFAIIFAIVLAGLGTAGVLFYALSADARARAAIGNPVTVAVAAKRIPAGTSGAKIRSPNEKYVRLVTMPRSSVPDDFLSGISAEYHNKVVTSNIAEGQILLRANFGEASSVTSGLPLPDGKEALAVEVGAHEQVAGYVRPGSEVVIFFTYSVVDKKECKRTKVLLPRVEVLAVGSDTTGTDGARGSTTNALGGTRSANPSLLITVAVNPEDAPRLVLAAETGSLYLGLLSDSVQPKTGFGVDCRDATGDPGPLFP